MKAIDTVGKLRGATANHGATTRVELLIYIPGLRAPVSVQIDGAIHKTGPKEQRLILQAVIPVSLLNGMGTSPGIVDEEPGVLGEDHGHRQGEPATEV